MRKDIFAIFVFCAIVSALATTKHARRTKPSATVRPPGEFNATTPTTNITTTTPPTTTTNITTTTITTTTTNITTTTTPLTTTNITTTTTPLTTTNITTTTTPLTTTNITTTTTRITTTPLTTTNITTTTTTTGAPTSAAPLTLGHYSLKGGEKGEVCLMAQMALQIKLATPKVNGTFIIQPKATQTEGSCQKSPANLTITFPEGFITFIFNQNKTAKTVYVDTLSLRLSYTFNAAGNNAYEASNKSLHLFAAKIGHSYSCKSDSVYMGNGLSLEVTQDRVQAFNLTGNTYGRSDLCPADQPDYRVAIAVGVILLVLIIIVVVAYLLGRRRRANGYQSL